MKKLKEAKKRESVKENCKEGDYPRDYVPAQIVCPGTKLFTKHRKLSKQNTYVKEINRRNRPLPDPSEEGKQQTSKLKESIKKYKRLKNRPLPNPNDIYSDDDENLPFLNYKYLKSDRDGIEYGQVLDSFSSPPESLFDIETDEEYDGENLYSEIDEYACTRNEIDLSDEEIDSANYSNENSSQENSIDTKINRTNNKHFKYLRDSRNFEVTAMIHNRSRRIKLPENLESDHYATLTIDDDDSGEDNDNVNKGRKDFHECMAGEKNKHVSLAELELTTRENSARDADKGSLISSHSGSLCDSLEDLPSLPISVLGAKPNKLKTFLDNDGTIKKKYLARQRNNHYESLDDVKLAVTKLSSTNAKESESVGPDTMVNANDKRQASKLDHSSYSSMITMTGVEETDTKTSIAILKITQNDSEEDQTIYREKNNNLGSYHNLTSSLSLANLTDIEDPDNSIKMRGNTILIKVLDDCPEEKVLANQMSSNSLKDGRLPLRKSCSISSINIVLDDNEDDYILGKDECRDGFRKEGKEPLNKKYPSLVRVVELPKSKTSDIIGEVTYYNQARITIEIPNSEISCEGSPTTGVPTQAINEPVSKYIDMITLNETSAPGVAIMSSSNELVISCGVDKPSSNKREIDSKSLDSGNASDDIEDSENSFDVDSLIDECDSTDCIKKALDYSTGEDNFIEAPVSVIEQFQDLETDTFDELSDLQEFSSTYESSVEECNFIDQIVDSIAMEAIMEEDIEDPISYSKDIQFDALSAITEETESPRSEVDHLNLSFDNIDAFEHKDNTGNGNEYDLDYNAELPLPNTEYSRFRDISEVKSDSVADYTNQMFSQKILSPNIMCSSFEAISGSDAATLSIDDASVESLPFTYVPLEDTESAVTPLSPTLSKNVSRLENVSFSSASTPPSLEDEPLLLQCQPIATCTQAHEDDAPKATSERPSHFSNIIARAKISKIPSEIAMESLKSFYNSPIVNSNKSEKDAVLCIDDNTSITPSELPNHTDETTDINSLSIRTISENIPSDKTNCPTEDYQSSNASDDCSVLSTADSGICFIQIK